MSTNPNLPASQGYGDGTLSFGLNNQASGTADLQFSNKIGSDVDDEDDEGEEGPKPKGKRAGRRKIKIEYIKDKSRRHITFSKRKAGIMKKAYELSTLTGTQVLLLVVSETGLVYTFTTPKLQPLVTKAEGKNLIQSCLNTPDEPPKENSPTNDPESEEPIYDNTQLMTMENESAKRSLDTTHDENESKKVNNGAQSMSQSYSTDPSSYPAPNYQQPPPNYPNPGMPHHAPPPNQNYQQPPQHPYPPPPGGQQVPYMGHPQGNHPQGHPPSHPHQQPHPQGPNHPPPPGQQSYPGPGYHPQMPQYGQPAQGPYPPNPNGYYNHPSSQQMSMPHQQATHQGPPHQQPQNQQPPPSQSHQQPPPYQQPPPHQQPTSHQ